MLRNVGSVEKNFALLYFKASKILSILNVEINIDND